MSEDTKNLTEAPEAALDRISSEESLPQPLPRKLTAGRTVFYKAREGEFQGLAAGVKYPATVVRAWSNTCATIAVFTESPKFPLHVVYSAVAGDDEGQWSWPELV